MTTTRSSRGLGRALGLALIASFALGCTSGSVHIDNATDIAVGVYQDGQWVGTYEAGTSGVASIGGKGRPSTLEVRSPSGAVLMTLLVNDDQLAAAERGGYGNGSSIGLPCGVVTVLIGRLAPDEALAPAESVPEGACP